ncbi:MAG: hypothetical protein LBD04_06655 [Synergistaceae bacterium]|nr:hypothetical protein [Synergistaceae bacterium]
MYVRDLDAVLAWNGAEWERESGLDFCYLVTKAAKEFGWTVGQIMETTPNELRALLDNLPRVNCEAALYTALAVGDPQQLKETLEEIVDAALTDRERAAKALKRLKKAMRQ